MDELEELRRQKDSEEFSKRTSQARSQLRGKLDKLHSQANPVTAKTNDGYRLPRPLKRGDDVLVVDIDKRATVLEEADKAGNIMVQAGIMKMRVKVVNLRLVEMCIRDRH